MIDLLPEDWRELLKEELNQSYVETLQRNVAQEYQSQIVFPPKELIFNAFRLCAVSAVKVVLIGQDPYHGKGQANGLCFSVQADKKMPPSLKNIAKELQNDVGVVLKNGDLTHWATQGVLMLNTVLTVREGVADSHKKLGWKKFTEGVVRELSEKKTGLVFLLWGRKAETLLKYIDAHKHTVLVHGHPSPMSANQGKWFGNRHFSLCNTRLKELGKAPIDW